MDEINKIRKAHAHEGMSIHALAQQYNRSWATVNRMVTMERESIEKMGTRPNRKSALLTDSLQEAVRIILDRELQFRVHRKQRYTATRLYKELREKGVFAGSLRRFQQLLREIRIERNELKPSAFLPLSFPLGTVLQVDHGEVDCFAPHGRVRSYLFVAAVPGTTLRYCQLFPIKSSEAWGEFHERAFRFFGGVFRRLMYDNDSVLVKEIIGHERRQTDFSLSLEEHFGFEINFCQPAAGNEKGSVENAVGYCRRNYLVGCPEIADFNRTNATLEGNCKKDCDNSTITALLENLLPLFPRRSWRKWSEVRVNSYQLIQVENRRYSVPERYVGSKIRVGLGIFDIEVSDGENCIVKYAREFGEKDTLVLDHYLKQLERKPGALWDCKAVQQEELSPEVKSLWRRLEQRYGNREANQQFIQILLLRRRAGDDAWNKAIKSALMSNAIEAGAIENELSCLNHSHDDAEIRLQNHLQHLSHDEIEFDLSIYDQLGFAGGCHAAA